MSAQFNLTRLMDKWQQEARERQSDDTRNAYTALQTLADEQGYRLCKYAGTDHLVLVAKGSGQYVFGGRGYTTTDIAQFLTIPTLH